MRRSGDYLPSGGRICSNSSTGLQRCMSYTAPSRSLSSTSSRKWVSCVCPAGYFSCGVSCRTCSSFFLARVSCTFNACSAPLPSFSSCDAAVGSAIAAMPNPAPYAWPAPPRYLRFISNPPVCETTNNFILSGTMCLCFVLLLALHLFSLVATLSQHSSRYSLCDGSFQMFTFLRSS